MLLLDERHQLQAIGLRHVKDNLEWNRQDIHVQLTVRQNNIVINEAEEIELINPANYVSSTVHRDCIVVDLITTMLKFAIASEKKHKEMIVKIRISDLVKDTIGTDYLKVTSAQFYYRCT